MIKKFPFVLQIFCSILLIYILIAGFINTVPSKVILNESIRNLYFHVPMWFTMMALFGSSVFFGIKYLMNPNPLTDQKSFEYINVGFLFGIAGLITGSVWAKNTWGAWWVFEDPKLNGTAIVMLEYAAYFILRGAINEETQKAKISAIYNIFAAASIIPLLFILPRINSSLHPGNGGNPGFNSYDLDNNMRMVFYPAVIAWMLLGYWIYNLRIRFKSLQLQIENKIEENEQIVSTI